MFGNILKYIGNYDAIRYNLAILGIDIKAGPRERTLKRPFCLIVPVSLSFLTIAASCYYICRQSNDMSLKTHIIYMGLQGLQTLAKAIVILVNARKLQTLQNNIVQLSKNAEGKEIDYWLKFVNNYRKIMAFYTIGVTVTGSVYGLSPVWHTFSKYFQTGEMKYYIPPWALFTDEKHLDPKIHFILAYFLYVAVYWLFVSASLAFDGFFTWFICTLCAHFCILQRKIKTIGVMVEYRNADWKHKLYNFIEHHQRVLQYIDEFGNLFKFMNLGSVTLALCTYGILIIQTEVKLTLEEIPYFITFFGAISIQLVILCSGGQFLKQAGCRLETSWDIPWHILEPKERSIFLIPIFQSLREISLNCYFFQLSNPLIVWILKTAYSFAAFIAGINEN